MTLVALSAAYGAGGTQVGPALAERLGVPFLDRAIPLAVAEQLHVSAEEAAAHDEQRPGSRLERMLSGFIGGDAGAPMPIPAQDATSDEFRDATEAVLREQAATGVGVILGRGATVVLREDPAVLRVRLTGPVERRVALAMQLGGISRSTAESAQRQLDRVHTDYLRHFYGVDIDDPSIYHLVIDSTAILLETCVEVIALAAKALASTGVPLDI
jgi:cytidylate kinase